MSLPADLKNLPTPRKLDINKIGENIGNAISFLIALTVFAIVLLCIILMAASIPVPKQLQTPAANQSTKSTMEELK